MIFELVMSQSTKILLAIYYLVYVVHQVSAEM